MQLRIHHFFDIIRDFGIGKEISPHPYGHSYHKIAKLIRDNPNIEIKIVLGTDDICNGCIHLANNHCNDTINHRSDFTSKEEFNNYIDKRILDKCAINIGDMLTPMQICKRISPYLENIFWIYEGNDEENTQTRKNNVINGLMYYKSRHLFS
jgi:hypothetical protein